MATPTAACGLLDPQVLLDRLARTAAEGWQPWEYDLQQALLRLPRDPRPDLADHARRLATRAGDRLARWLTDGGLADPTVLRQNVTVFSRPALRAAVVPPPTLPEPGPPPPWAHGTGDTGEGGGFDPLQASLATRLCALPAPTGRQYDYYAAARSWFTCWPAILPAYRDVTAAHLIPYLEQLTDTDHGTAIVLPLLAETDGPLGPAMTLALAYGLGATDARDRASTVDALLTLAGLGQLDSAALGADIATLTSTGTLKLTRVVPALRDAATAGAYPHVWPIIAAALPPLLGEKPPNRIADLLALGTEIAGKAGADGAIPALAAYAERNGANRTATEARRLHRLLTEHGST
jgi:hypothetical protein